MFRHVVPLALVLACAAPAEAATIRIGNVRVNQSPSTRNPKLTVDVAGTVSPQAGVTVETDQGRTFVLEAGALERRASVEVFAGESDKGFEVTLDLEDKDGKVLWRGVTRLGGDITSRQWDDPYGDADKAPWEWVGAAQLHSTATPGRYAISFTVYGDGATAIAGGTLVTRAGGEKPVTSTTALDAESFTDTRPFSTEVRFDGDPVGSVYDLTVELLDSVNGSRPQPERTKVQLEIFQLAGEGGMPGPILGITSNGKGTRNVASNTNSAPKLL
jgi:hypothetical protein